MLDPTLLEILVCPIDRGPLLHIGAVLYNPRLRKAYRIEDDIPVEGSAESIEARLAGMEEGNL